MRALIVAGETRPDDELRNLLIAQGYEVAFVAGDADALCSEAANARLVFVDVCAGVAMATLVCARLKAIGDFAPFRVLYGDAPQIKAAEELLDGSVMAFLVRGAEMNDARVRAFTGTSSTRSRAATVLREAQASSAEVTSMVDSLQEGILVQMRTGEVVRTNAAARRILGLSQEDVVARRWRSPDWALTEVDGTPIDKDEVPSLVCLRTGKSARDVRMRMVRPDGRAIVLSINVEPVFADDSGVPSTVVTSITDITDQSEQEDALRKLLDLVSDGVLIHREGTMLFMNAHWAKLVDAKDRHASIGKKILDRVSPENREIIAQRLADAGKGATVSARELRFQHGDGSVVTALIHTFPTIFEGKPAVLTYARDVTEQRSLEAKLIASNRMAALGRLAANVGHEINNPLAFLVGSAESALSQVTNGEDAATIAATIRNVLDGATRVQNIVADLKVLSRPSAEVCTATDVATVLESCLRIAARTIAPRAQVKMVLLSRSRAICNEARIGQVFLNLLMNAAEAIPSGEPDRHTITVTTEDRPPYVVVTIADTGAGIPAEHIGSIFEPFFTTKTDGRGTGLGLSISHSLITAQGGRIAAESAVGNGTRMIVHLPMAESAPANGASPHHPAAHAGDDAARRATGFAAAARRHRILVVDDEVQLGRLIQGFLAEYDVTVATSGMEGQNKLDSAQSFDLILCDLMMPDVTGMDLYEYVRRVRPELCARFVFMTGGAFTSPAIAFLDEVAARGNACVEKPFRIDGLVATIAAKLAELTLP